MAEEHFKAWTSAVRWLVPDGFTGCRMSSAGAIPSPWLDDFRLAFIEAIIWTSHGFIVTLVEGLK